MLRLFFEKRPRWGLTLAGWCMLGITVIGGGGLALRVSHPFLALHHPVAADLLVVEGWVPEYAVDAAAALFRQGSYRQIVTVGGPVTGMHSPAKDDDTHAYVAAIRLRKAGLAPSQIVMVPTNRANRDRSFSAAADFGHWLAGQKLSPKGINVVTLGPHARRSRLLFETALGPSIPVGVISIPNQEYDSEAWWRYSEGIKESISEAAAYLYTRFWFLL